MQVSEIMTTDPACCTADKPISEAARLMRDNDCGEIPIVDDMESRKPTGVVTDRDIACRAVADNKGPDTAISEVMSTSVITVNENADVQDCIDKMEQHQIRRMPIVDGQGRLCGIVAQADIARHTGSREAGEVVRDVSRQQH